MKSLNAGLTVYFLFLTEKSDLEPLKRENSIHFLPPSSELNQEVAALVFH